jgi:ATP-binding cassette, subfamily B, multidrug efflux pump
VLIRLMREFLRPYRLPMVLIAAFQLAQTIAILYLPTLNADIIDNGVVEGDIGYILRIGGVMLAVSLVQICCASGAVYFGARTSMAFGRDVRAALFDRVQSFSTREVGRFGTPSLITRTTNDVQQVQMLVLMTFTLMVSAPIMCVGGILLAVRQDAPLSSLLLIIVPVLAVVVSLIIMRMRPLFRQMQERIDEITRVLREQITGVRVIRAFVRDTRERERFTTANTELLGVSLGVGRLMAIMFPAVMLVINASSVAVLWFGGERIDSGAMQIGALTAFLSYLLQILMSVMMATFMFMMVPRAEVCAERITEVLDTESSVVPPSDPVRLREAGAGGDGGAHAGEDGEDGEATKGPEGRGEGGREGRADGGPEGRTPGRRGHLELRDVEFRYPGAEEPVLRGVNLVAVPGETTAIIGSTGSGKTTLLNLVPRLFDATGGAVLIDGADVRDLDPAELSRVIGLVPQKPYLFSGTVASNLRYGKSDATDDELWRALEIAQARGFVERMEGGLDAPIAQGGTNVSGGQRQRLAIARALVHGPGLFLFDDSFSALDYATDAALRAALTRETDDAAVVIVAQRVSTIRHADRIVVLDKGRVAGTGTHRELMDTNQTYREIVLSQLTEQEAA